MKNLLLAICLLFCGAGLQAQDTNCRISGKIKGLTADSVFAIVNDASAPRGFVRVKMPVENESFSGSIKVNSMSKTIIFLNMQHLEKNVPGGFIPSVASSLFCFTYPGANIHFTGNVLADFVDAYPSGDQANADLAELNKGVYPIQNQLVNLEVKRISKLVTDPAILRKMQDTVSLLRKDLAAVKRTFLASKPKSVAAAWLLNDMMLRSELSNPEAESFFTKMDQGLAANTFYQSVSERVAGFNATKLGNQAPAIVSKSTPDGNEISLANFKGKWVIIDFWGTWCGPCMKGMPQMREYLEKYKTKLEILGIAVEDQYANWKSVIKSANLNWHHIYNLPKENFALKYNVAGYPTKIIIDPTGKIVDRYVGEDDRIYQKLDELLK